MSAGEWQEEFCARRAKLLDALLPSLCWENYASFARSRRRSALPNDSRTDQSKAICFTKARPSGPTQLECPQQPTNIAV